MRSTLAVLLLVASLAGCSSSAPPESLTTPTPTPTPTIRILTVEEAAPVYLAAICKSNAGANAVTNALNSYDLAAIIATAASARDAARDTAGVLNDREGRWPADIQEDIDVVMGQLLGEAGWYDSLVTATSVDQAFATVYPDELMSRESAQRIRLELDLPADTSAGCADIGKLIF